MKKYLYPGVVGLTLLIWQSQIRKINISMFRHSKVNTTTKRLTDVCTNPNQ